jgi:hypothetical protein
VKCASIEDMQNGILPCLLSAILFGASTPLAKIMPGRVDPWMLSDLGIGLAIVHESSDHRPEPNGR